MLVSFPGKPGGPELGGRAVSVAFHRMANRAISSYVRIIPAPAQGAVLMSGVSFQHKFARNTATKATAL